MLKIRLYVIAFNNFNQNAENISVVEIKAFKRHVKLKEKFWNNDRVILLSHQTNDFGLNW